MSFKGGAGLWLSVWILSCSGKTILSIGCCDTCWQNRRNSYSFPQLQRPAHRGALLLSISLLTMLVIVSYEHGLFFFFKEWLLSVDAQLGSTILRTHRSQSLDSGCYRI